MGALVVAVNKKNENAVPTVAAMLQELVHRGKQAHGISTPSDVETAHTIKELKDCSLASSVALGHNLSKLLPRDRAQPVRGNGFTMVFEGRSFPPPSLPDTHEVNQAVKMLGSDRLRGCLKILEGWEGAYVFAVAESGRVIMGRDALGVAPLYYGEDETVCAVASERKALWKIGLKTVHPFPPGHVAVMDSRGFNFRRVWSLRVPRKRTLSMETAARALQLLLLESTRRRVSDLEAVAVAFSGGVDSSVVAVLAENVGLKVQLVSVELEGQRELGFIEEAAEALDLPLHLQTYSVDELEESVEEVLWLVEEPHVTSACIAVPFFWMAETVSKLGYPVVLAGQGADELFGGYHRYLTTYEQKGVEATEKNMAYDIENAYNANFQRDNQVCSAHGVELRLPYIDRHIVEFAVRLPLHLKISSPEDELRKRVLRRVANSLDIPEFIADKPKKAVQYTAGVTKALQKIAKKKDYALRGYIEETFRRVCPSAGR